MKHFHFLLLFLLSSCTNASITWLCDWFPDWNIPFVDCDGDSSPGPGPSPSSPSDQPVRCNSNPTSSTRSNFDFGFSYRNVGGSERSMFERAASRWQRVIIGDVQDANVPSGSSRCGSWPSRVDDLVRAYAYYVVRSGGCASCLAVFYLFLFFL